MHEPSSSDREEALAEHVGELLKEARKFHQQATALLGTPDPNTLPRQRETKYEIVKQIRLVNLLCAPPEFEQAGAFA